MQALPLLFPLNRIRIRHGSITKTSRSCIRTLMIQQLTDSAPLSSRAKSRDLNFIELIIVRDSSATFGMSGKRDVLTEHVIALMDWCDMNYERDILFVDYL